MKIPVKPGSINAEIVKSKLSQSFPGYEISDRSKNLLLVKLSSSVGANVLLKNSKIKVSGAFPTFGGQMLFLLALLILGIVIGLIIYLLFFHGKMKRLEREIGLFLQKEYGLPPG